MYNTTHFTALKKQQGAVLIVSLIMLLVLTIIGVTGMSTTVLEEKMAGNMNDQNMAFQAAEAALREGEDIMENLVALSSFNGTAGRLGSSDDDPDFYDDATWSDGSSITYSGTIDGVYEQPRMILKYIGQSESNSRSLKMRGNGARRTDSVSTFRVTARGVGQSANSTALLQAYYGKIM